MSDQPYTKWIFGGIAILLVTTFGVAFAILGHRTPFEDVASSAPRSVYLVAIETGGKRLAIGTAFTASTKGMLATSADIAAELDKRGAFAPGGDVRAVAVLGGTSGDANVETSNVRRIMTAAVAPEWQPGSLERNVALLQLDAGPALIPLKLGNADLIAQVVRGTPIAVFGFPTDLIDADNPRGRLSVGVAGDVQGENISVAAGLLTDADGSPVFDQSGNVVGLVAGKGLLTIAPIRDLLGR
jgi:hypothetical protein